MIIKKAEKENTIQLYEYLSEANISDALNLIISLYNNLGVKEKLPPRQITYYIAITICTLLDVDIYSEMGTKVFNDVVGSHRRYYRGKELEKIRKMGWLDVVGKDVILPDFLKQLKVESGRYTYNLVIEWQ